MSSKSRSTGTIFPLPVLLSAAVRLVERQQVSTSRRLDGGMAFKLFQKKTNGPAERAGEKAAPSSDTLGSPVLMPATPRGKVGTFSLTGANTPTLTDGSLRGEQKRYVMLEQQLREVSLTASKAYDKIDDLKMKNGMLEDQVVQQKQLIETFTKQLEQSNAEMQEMKRAQLENVRKERIDRDKKAEMVSALVHEKDLLVLENERLEREVERLRQMYNDNSAAVQQRQAETAAAARRSTPSTPFVPGPPATVRTPQHVVGEYQSIIQSLEQRIRELEQQAEAKNVDYEHSLSTLKNTMIVLNNNKMFFNKKPDPGSSDYDLLVDDDVFARDDGDTYVLQNVSFLP